jgi:hypothetical protein
VRDLEAAFEIRTWTEEEQIGLNSAFWKVHGHYETLFAVAAWILRYRKEQLDKKYQPEVMDQK